MRVVQHTLRNEHWSDAVVRVFAGIVLILATFLTLAGFTLGLLPT